MRFRDEMAASVPPGMRFPEEIALLCDWIEEHGHILSFDDGSRVGLMHEAHAEAPEDLDADVPGGTNIQLMPEGTKHWASWSGTAAGGARVSVFARTGGDGSVAAFWLAPDGTQKIVHLGSGSGSTLMCVLADNPIDFLRLLAIGYGELCWADRFDDPPNKSEADEDEPRVKPNKPFQAWVRKTFRTTIPKTASEIVKHPSSMDSARSDDPFWNWVKHVQRASE